MSATIDAMLAEVASHLGFVEGPNNANPFGVWYGLPNQPYCDMGISYCADRIGASDIIGRFAWTVAHAQWFALKGQFNTTPTRGAIVFFDWSGGKDIGGIDHVGIVESVAPNGWVTTLEFNTNGPNGTQGCWRKVRNPAYIVGYGHPAYATITIPTPAPTAPATKVPPRQAYHGWVYRSKLHVGQQNSDTVRHLQAALRDYPGIRTIPLNPHGITGNYGPETVAMVRKVYQTFDAWQPGAGWGTGDLTIPGPALLDRLGLRLINA